MKHLTYFLKPVMVLMLLFGVCRNSSAQAIWSSVDFTYNALSFKDVRSTGSYGMEMNIIGINSKSKFGAGMNAGYGMTYGLVPAEYGQYHYVNFGPALGYSINSYMVLILPIDVLCSIVSIKDLKPEAHSWSLTITPTFKLAKGGGITLGPQMTIPFVKGEKVMFGFKAGICFGGLVN